jgi:hypothetical protein
LQVHFTVEDENVFTMPWSAVSTYWRASGDWTERVCAENSANYYAGLNTAIPKAENPISDKAVTPMSVSRSDRQIVPIEYRLGDEFERAGRRAGDDQVPDFAGGRTAAAQVPCGTGQPLRPAFRPTSTQATPFKLQERKAGAMKRSPGFRY